MTGAAGFTELGCSRHSPSDRSRTGRYGEDYPLSSLAARAARVFRRQTTQVPSNQCISPSLLVFPHRFSPIRCCNNARFYDPETRPRYAVLAYTWEPGCPLSYSDLTANPERALPETHSSPAAPPRSAACFLHLLQSHNPSNTVPRRGFVTPSYCANASPGS